MTEVQIKKEKRKRKRSKERKGEKRTMMPNKGRRVEQK
jgi:hypothetical protein